VNPRVLELELASEQYNGTGLRVAYLSGKHSAELYQNAKAAAAAGAHHEDDVDTLRAFADDPSITDLFLSYPLLLLLRIGECWKVLPFVLGFRVQDFVFQAGLQKKFSLSLSLIFLLEIHLEATRVSIFDCYFYK